MSDITGRDKTYLDNFHKTQPGLTYSGQMGSNSYPDGVKIGTLLEKAMSSVAVSADWTFSVHGGAVTPDIDLGAVIPAGAIITAVYTYVLSACTAASEFVVKAGSSDLCTVADASALAGVELQTTTLTQVSADSKLYLNINTTAATDGSVRIIVQYFNP